jgi:copper chaperone CopZ
MATTTYAVTGMTCEHCVHAVTEELSAIAGAAMAFSSVFVVSQPPAAPPVPRVRVRR